MYIVTQPGDLSTTASMSEEGQTLSEHEPVSAFIPPQNPQEGIKEVKKSAFEITHVAIDNENEDLDASQLVHNRTTTGEDDDNPGSPLSADILTASTPSKNVPSSSKDVMQSTSALPVVTSIATTTNSNGPPHLSAPGGRFRKVNEYVRERWQVTDSLEVDTDEHLDTPEPRGAPIQKVIENASNSSSPSTPRRNTSLDIASSNNLSDAKSDVQLDEAARNEGATLTEVPSVITSRRASTEFSQDDNASTDDNCENFSQGMPSETNVRVDTESTNIMETSSISLSVETIKSETVKILTNVETIISESAKLKQTVESLKTKIDKLEREVQQLRNSGGQQMSSAIPS